MTIALKKRRWDYCFLSPKNCKCLIRRNFREETTF